MVRVKLMLHSLNLNLFLDWWHVVGLCLVISHNSEPQLSQLITTGREHLF